MRVRGSSGPSLWLRLIAANFDLHVYQNVRQIYWVTLGGSVRYACLRCTLLDSDLQRIYACF